MYFSFIEHIDAQDHGIGIAERPLYQTCNSLPYRISLLHRHWGEDYSDLFKRAMAISIGEFIDMLHYYTTDWLPNRLSFSIVFICYNYIFV